MDLFGKYVEDILNVISIWNRSRSISNSVNASTIKSTMPMKYQAGKGTRKQVKMSKVRLRLKKCNVKQTKHIKVIWIVQIEQLQSNATPLTIQENVMMRQIMLIVFSIGIFKLINTIVQQSILII